MTFHPWGHDLGGHVSLCIVSLSYRVDLCVECLLSFSNYFFLIAYTELFTAILLCCQPSMFEEKTKSGSRSLKILAQGLCSVLCLTN